MRGWSVGGGGGDSRRSKCREGRGAGHALVRLTATVPFCWCALSLRVVGRSAAGRLEAVERPRGTGCGHALVGLTVTSAASRCASLICRRRRGRRVSVERPRGWGGGHALGLTRVNLTKRDCSSGDLSFFGQFSSAASTGVRDEELVERFGWILPSEGLAGPSVEAGGVSGSPAPVVRVFSRCRERVCLRLGPGGGALAAVAVDVGAGVSGAPPPSSRLYRSWTV